MTLKMVLLCVGSFVAGFIGLYLFASVVSNIRNRRRKKKRKQTEEVTTVPKEKKPVPKPKTMDVILVVIAAFLLWFTNRMIGLYELTGGVPDTLITCVFAVCGGECGVMGWIKTTKDKQQERKWQLEDMKNQSNISAAPTEPDGTGERNNL